MLPTSPPARLPLAQGRFVKEGLLVPEWAVEEGYRGLVARAAALRR